MRLSWKLFFTTIPIFVLFLTGFGTWMIQENFQRSLDQMIEQAMAENQMFQNSYELTRNSLSERQWEQTSLQSVVGSFHRRRERTSGNARIYDQDGTVLYQDNVLQVPNKIMDELTGGPNVGYELIRMEKDYYLVILGRSRFGVYIETIRNVNRIYRERNEMYASYQIGLLALTVLIGAVILAVLFLAMRNMQKLSRATRQFARGQYDTRVVIRSRDEVGRLADDFNWMAEAMKVQMAQLQNEVKRQEEFTAAFAHELKTPLTSIIGYADTIRQMDLSKEETDMCADYIFQQGKRLQTLSYKLLEMSMTGKQEIAGQTIFVPDFLQEIAHIAGVSLEEKRLTLDIEAENGVICGDRDLLSSLFLNLIDNARKASDPDRTIWIRGTLERDGYQITVQDEGHGISKEELARITEAFYMVDKSRARKEGGAGLGLALCQKIIELHRAGWRFESEPGQGLRVTVMFWNAERPVRRRSRPERPVRDSSGSRGQSRRRKRA